MCKLKGQNEREESTQNNRVRMHWQAVRSNFHQSNYVAIYARTKRRWHGATAHVPPRNEGQRLNTPCSVPVQCATRRPYLKKSQKLVQNWHSMHLTARSTHAWSVETYMQIRSAACSQHTKEVVMCQSTLVKGLWYTCKSSAAMYTRLEFYYWSKWKRRNYSRYNRYQKCCLRKLWDQLRNIYNCYIHAC